MINNEKMLKLAFGVVDFEPPTELNARQTDGPTLKSEYVAITHFCV